MFLNHPPITTHAIARITSPGLTSPSMKEVTHDSCSLVRSKNATSTTIFNSGDFASLIGNECRVGVDPITWLYRKRFA